MTWMHMGQERSGDDLISGPECKFSFYLLHLRYELLQTETETINDIKTKDYFTYLLIITTPYLYDLRLAF